jgi:hypothetical protein
MALRRALITDFNFNFFISLNQLDSTFFSASDDEWVVNGRKICGRMSETFDLNSLVSNLHSVCNNFTSSAGCLHLLEIYDGIELAEKQHSGARTEEDKIVLRQP